jgi:PIN domain nuclease of toxin-antitoxin system
LSAFVLDASGLLAFLQDEAGASEVEQALASTGAISTANLAEALSKLAQQGTDPGELVAELEDRGVLGGLLEVEPLTAEDAIAIAEMRVPTHERGLGLGDRACLALGRRLGLPVMTADRVWVELEEAVGVQVHPLR